jgi:2-oxoglutarate ferredoxin oxidoreductase subunit alpha
MKGKEETGCLPSGVRYLSGNEAAAEGALAAGCRYYAGYPITPSSDIMERIAFRLPEVGGVFIQMEDEIASICSVIGASWAGLKAMTATSGPGFSLMMEAVGYSAFTETPIVIVDVQRAGPGTGQATRVGSGDIMQAKWGSHGDYQVIAYAPWSVQEMFDFTVRAFNMAERYRVPSFVLADEAVGHVREKIFIPESVEVAHRKKKPGAQPFNTTDPDGVPPMPAFGEGECLLVTGSTHDGYGFRKSDSPEVHAQLVSRLNAKITEHRSEIVEVEKHYMEDEPEVAVVCYGFTARSALFAVEKLRSEGLRVGMLRLKTLWPFPDEAVREAGAHAGKIFVPEMNMGQVAGEAMKYAKCEVVPYCQTDGEVINPAAIAEGLRRIYHGARP